MTKKHEPGMAYDTKKLNKVFAVISVIFLITVVWVFMDDYLRPWKAVQIEARLIKQEKLKEKLKQANLKIDKQKLAELEKQLDDAEMVVSTREDKIELLEDKLAHVDVKIKDETIINGTLNSKVSALGFNYGVAHAKHARNAGELFSKLRKTKKLFAESKDRMKTLESEKKGITKQIEDLRAEVIKTEKEIKELVGTRDLLKKAYNSTTLDPVFALRNAPIIDYMDPTLKIEQVVIENITDDRYFQHVPKVDRCMTCHTFIDKPGYEDLPNPHKTHPNLDLMVGMKSHHPMKSFGCTSCHGGEGHRVNDFNAAAHIPHSEEQKLEWIKKYNWHEPHKVPQVMLKNGYAEASCIKCHKGVEYIPQGTVVNEGKRNIERYGCYACHKIEGWEHKRKPGPSLEKIAAKIDKEFFKKWVWDPKSFNKHANMPAFFDQDNNKDPRFMVKNIAEVNAMAEYIWDKSKKYEPTVKFIEGNKERGKKLLNEVGCMGCHGVEGFELESKKVDAYAGPYLTATGTKIKDADWLVTWLIKPSHYQENTIMPSFRLSNREARDIATYLLSLKNNKFEKKAFVEMDKKARDEILVEYFTAFDTIEVANKKLERMSDRERTLELGHRSIGKYGCYSCHSIEGFDGRAPIGPELSKVGSKPLTQFGFVHEHDVEHSRDGWIKAHLINPRRWDNGVDKPFKDLLRMPNFNMSEKHAETITVALIGQVGDRIPMAGVKRLDKHEAVVAEGMKVVTKYNCIGCHKIDGDFGDLLRHPEYEDDINLAPPRLNGQGHRVQSDWFFSFLDEVEPIRPWLNVRMPSFNLSQEERNKIVAMFQAKEKQPTFDSNDAKVVWLPGERKGALQLFKSLECASCHTQGFNNETPTAPDLRKAKSRLRDTWIKKWLSNPQAIMEGTVMPSFWEDGVSIDEEVFGGNAERQMNALVKYLIEIGEDKK